MITQRNKALAKKLNIAAWIISIVVLIVVVLMRRIKLDVGVDFSFLPPIHASLNAVTAVLLVIAVNQIRKGHVAAHQKLMTTAMITSILFLISYVLYHTTSDPTSYGGQGVWRMIYFILLITHVVLAAIILPFILFTFIRGYTGQIDRHKKMAKWVYPVWLYVALTGPICYLMLRPYYG